ncbi:MAG TPA: tRNA (N(6)-L-threonylcarbamoyladenosine(37)-C(2))-methylthiotransferase MtaB [Candidatus Eisenbacteria bacterium]|nr:tRNA (N(6)-L-threonylcarbamoyladenosine(37)-C(2))-methylthiotransferase MtaB [Candidatus Eisenbacteria bacterium]
MSGPTVAFATLGCRLNQVESQEMRALVEQAGYRAVEPGEAAQVYVVNTCTVTSKADFSDRQVIRRILRASPEARVVVTGCLAQTDPDTLARMSGVDLVVGNQEKYRLPELLASLATAKRPEVHVAPIADAREIPAVPVRSVSGRSRAFVKVQDGCQHRCAFCIVPSARGRSRSQAPAAVVGQIQALVASGYGEVTLTGVDIGHYGWDLHPRTNLAALVGQAALVKGLRWLRLGSVLPAYFTPELVEAVTSLPAVVAHQHLPLQSGSDRVLRLMRRPYNIRMYRALAERLATAIPDLGLGADIIVGHPGESDGDFEATMALVRELPLTYLHVFAYSDRKGTEAAGMDGHVPAPLIRERSRRLRDLGTEKNLAFRQRLVGRTVDALVLEPTSRGGRAGLTANYVEVGFERPGVSARSFAKIRVTEADARGTRGVLEAA